jgi:hypothetical protein
MRTQSAICVTLVTCLHLWAANSCCLAEDPFKPVPLQSKIENVQPLTGLVLWTTNEKLEHAPVQLEFSYIKYSDLCAEPGVYRWDYLETLLNEVAAAKHQAILRFYDTYPGKPTEIPAYIRKRPGYKERTAKSEGKPTGFPDWSHPDLASFVIDFFTAFAAKYDSDPRIAYVQVGFGLWSEYHIYDGPFELGKTFPSKEFQTQFARHLSDVFFHTPWMISVDASDDEVAPFSDDDDLRGLKFGLFDDSLLCKQHEQENEPDWDAFDRSRWQTSPAGGEFSYYTPRDQKLALSPNGPNGMSLEEAAKKFHLSFVIADAQPEHQPLKRLQSAGLALGYKFRVTKFEANSKLARVTITNTGVAPIYYDAYVAIASQRAPQSLKGLLPGASLDLEIPLLTTTGIKPPQIECDRLVPGQSIDYEADLK